MEDVDHSKRSNTGPASSTDTTNGLSLSYPTLAVDNSITSLVLVSHPTMRPAPLSRTPSETASSLEDSTYDLVSNTDLSESGILSDDDARTESLASFDGNTPDDMSVINSADDSEEEEDEALNTPLDSILLGSMQAHHATATSDEPVVDVTPAIGDSGYTSHTVRPESSFSYLDFYVNDSEPCGPNDTNLVHSVQSINEANCNMELSVYSSPYVGVDMHMAVSNTILKPRDSFRMLIMSYYTHFNNEITEHVRQAVQTTLRGSASRDQPVLVVHHCAGGAYGSDGREIVLTLDRPGPSMVNIRGGKAFLGKEPYPQWDLAIFLHTSLANIPSYEIRQLENTFEKARLAMRSAGIPIMDLSSHHPLYKAAPHLYTCDRKSLHLRVTTKKSKDANEIPNELLPIDLDKFFAIDPRTLGRHLACITEGDAANIRTSHKRKRSVVYDSAYTAYASAKKFVRPVGVRVRDPLRFFQSLQWGEIMFGLLVGLAAVVFCSFVPSYLSSAQTKLQARIPPAPLEVPPIQHVETWANLLGHKLSGLSERPAVDDVPSVQSKPTAIGKQSKTKKTQDPSNVDEDGVKSEDQLKREETIKKEHDFLLQASKQWTWTHIGSHTFTLTPSFRVAKFTSSEIQVSLFWKGKKRETKYLSMTNGGWTLDLGQRFEEGEASVIVQGQYQLENMGRVPFSYEFPVVFGNGDAKSSFETVRDLVTQEFILVQNNAVQLSTRMTTGLQQYMDDLQQHAIKRVGDTRKALLDMSSRTTLHSEWKLKREQLRQLRKSKTLSRKGMEFLKEIEDAIHGVPDMIQEKYNEAINNVHNAIDTIRAIPQWQRNTAWPVRAADWEPKAAIKRGWGNARGLLRKLRGGPKLIEAEAHACRGWVPKRKAVSCSGKRRCKV